MSILEKQLVDIIATRPDSAIVKLMITDHLPWNDFEFHAGLLQDKINTYLEFIESGQLSRCNTPRIPEAPEIWIVLAVQHPPDETATAFLSQVTVFLQSLHVRFEVESHHD